MGTRSTIALEFADGTVEQVYCHWDGYLAHNGQILQKHYINPFILRDLIDLGDISSLGKEIGEKHAFSHFELRAEEVQAYKELTENWTTFYGRDRGETGAGKKSFVDFQDYLAHHQYEEYDYILRNINGKATWFVSDHDGAYVELTQAIMDEQDRIAQEETA
jgi:hypothetical protein